MAAGDVFRGEGRTFPDPKTGVTVRQLTDWHAHSHHLYFTNEGLWDGGRRLLVGSQRNNAYDLFSVDLDSGDITQLTDLSRDARGNTRGAEVSLLQTSINPMREEAYFTWNREVTAVDLRSHRTRSLYETPAGYRPGNLSVTADGRTICYVVGEDLSARIRTDLMHGYVGFAETFEAHPHCRIVAIPVDGGAARVLHEEKNWIGHVNTSPTQAHLLTFCHEGPWTRLQRMWGLDIRQGRVWPLRPQASGEAVGHEYWYEDGLRVGYHGWKDDKTRMFGFVNWDGAGISEAPCAGHSMHFHSLDENLIVGDGGREDGCLLVWRLHDGRYDGPRILATHRGSFHVQIVHVHPRVFRGRDGNLQVAFTGDHNGYGNVFIVNVPDFGSLPPLG